MKEIQRYLKPFICKVFKIVFALIEKTITKSLTNIKYKCIM